MILLNNLYWKARTGFQKFLRDEKGDVNVVSIVVLIGVAVVLALVFKNAITELITGLIGQITGNANQAIAPQAK